MSDREEYILDLLREADNRIEGRTRLMKLAFLADRTLEKKGEPSPFEFRAYKHGPFDKGVLDVIDEFVEKGLVEEDIEPTPYGEMHVYSLTDEGRQKAKGARDELGTWERKAVKGTVDRWRDTQTQSLIGYVYDTYPEYTPN